MYVFVLQPVPRWDLISEGLIPRGLPRLNWGCSDWYPAALRRGSSFLSVWQIYEMLLGPSIHIGYWNSSAFGFFFIVSVTCTPNWFLRSDRYTAILISAKNRQNWCVVISQRNSKNLCIVDRYWKIWEFRRYSSIGRSVVFSFVIRLVLEAWIGRYHFWIG